MVAHSCCCPIHSFSGGGGNGGESVDDIGGVSPSGFLGDSVSTID